jgi:hypothetical protein
MKTSTGLRMAMTPKTLIALEVVKEDSLVEFPASPKLEPPINPKANP